MKTGVFSLALKSLHFRRTSVGLTILSLALSIVLLLGVDTIRVQAKDHFANTLSGTDLIVGSRSGAIQLLLYTVFHIGNPTNNVGWKSYEKIISHPRVEWSIPVSLGDSHKGYRVIGTNTDFFRYFQYGRHKSIQFAHGTPFEKRFDVVIGSEVSSKLNYALGDSITISHGMGNVSFTEHKDRPFRISGILQATGTPVDRSVLISLQALEAIHLGWEHGVANPNNSQISELTGSELPIKSITAFFLGLKSKHDIFGIQRAINSYKGEPLLAILPGVTLLELWKVVGVIEKVLLIIAALVVVTGLLGMLSILLTTLNERRRELAVLRSVGASPRKIFLMLVIEAEILVALGAILGVLLLYATVLITNPILAQTFGLQIELSMLTPFQCVLLLLVLAGGLLAALIPAWNAYRNTLQDGLTQKS